MPNHHKRKSDPNSNAVNAIPVAEVPKTQNEFIIKHEYLTQMSSAAHSVQDFDSLAKEYRTFAYQIRDALAVLNDKYGTLRLYGQNALAGCLGALSSMGHVVSAQAYAMELQKDGSFFSILSYNNGQGDGYSRLAPYILSLRVGNTSQPPLPTADQLAATGVFNASNSSSTMSNEFLEQETNSPNSSAAT